MSSTSTLPPQSYSAAGYPHRNIPPPLNFRKLQGSFVAKVTGSSIGGLRTPPAEGDMSAAYHHPMVAGNTYDAHVALARHPNGIAPPRVNTSTVIYNVAVHPQPKSQSQSSLAQPLSSQLPTTYALRSHPSATSSRTLTQPSASTQPGTSRGRSEDVADPGTEDSSMVMHSLKLPKCISPNGGNLDDFAALMTCFFWFETMDTIEAAEQINAGRLSEPLAPLSKYTVPCPSYKKWVSSILSTTQVTQNVVLLALLFVYRLKKTNPRVHGNPGSEYRLLTVALMLGNKFLDDNTYTNKTWADVSGISVKEIHVMEVEFLSNMRYGLLTSKEQWQEWLEKLACYHAYCERSRAEEVTRQAQNTPVYHLSPNGNYVSPLPSPTALIPTSMHAPSSLAAAYSPPPASQSSWDSMYHPTPTVSPLATKPSLGHPMVRKRSLEATEEPAPKRTSRPLAQPTVPLLRPIPCGTDPVRLPAPQLTLDTSPVVVPNAYGPSNHAPQSVVSLPPLNVGIRAMSTVYSTPTTTWAHQGVVLPTCGPQTPSYTVPSNYGTPTRRHSPSAIAAFGSSPLAEAYASHTPISNSPSVYLQQRASPYKPVRRVNTLLNPAPSIPLAEYHFGSSQMHYQPIGRRHDVRSGIVPEFMPTYGHQQRHQLHPYH
ncbi:putative cyclin [Rosellinia necatrix]|uniref:Putative cyclin n=1 Tax=Rosellinia necatrix TaxID=77044 RepID=A0A1W2TKU6_ROSNE|nr:putative cyclin [Rosellinia necatrix]